MQQGPQFGFQVSPPPEHSETCNSSGVVDWLREKVNYKTLTKINVKSIILSSTKILFATLLYSLTPQQYLEQQCAFVNCEAMIYVSFLVSGGSRGREGCVLPLDSKFLHFHAVFGKNGPNNRLAPPLGLAPLGNPGSATASDAYPLWKNFHWWNKDDVSHTTLCDSTGR